jgi:hypothetical protein
MASGSLGRIGWALKRAALDFGHWLIDDDSPSDPVDAWLRSRSKRADAKAPDRREALGTSLDLIRRREQGQISEADFEVKRREIQAEMPPPRETALGFVAAYGFLVLVLLGTYLAYVAVTGWTILTVLSMTVSTAVWMVTVVGSAVLGIVVFYGFAGLSERYQRIGPMVVPALLVVPAVTEALVFGLVRPA